MMHYGLQLYSVRDALADNYKATLADVARMGYKMVETFGGMGPGADILRSWFDKYGLSCVGTHTGASELADDVIAQTIADHHTIGCNLLIIPGHDLSTAAKVDEFIALVNRAQPILAKEGIRLAFHNHSREFLPNEDGQIVHNELRDRTRLFFELDTYWAYNAGVDPLQKTDELGDRLVAIHLKDGLLGGEGKHLGQGTAPVRDVHDKAKALCLPIVVESESLTPNGPEEAESCFNYLKSIQNT